MPLPKPIKDLKIAICVPAYKRPEYTQMCMKALADAQDYNGDIFVYDSNSLRSVIIKFFEETKEFDIIAKIDNDCLVPKNWLNDILKIFEEYDVDIISPNVYPSMAGNRWSDKGLPFIQAPTVGGLWVMRRDLIDDMFFDDYDVLGIKGAYAVLKQIINEKNAKVGWAKDVIVQDVGHWSGNHPMHIKSDKHKNYSKEVGRGISW